MMAFPSRKCYLAIAATSIFASTFGGCGGGAARHTGEGRIRAEGHGFSLVPPKGWSSVKTPPNILTFKGPADDGFAVNFTVGADPYNGKPPLEELPKEMRAKKPPQLTLVEDGFATIDGKKAYFTHVRIRAEAGTVSNIQYFFPSGRTMYSISFAVAPSAHERHKDTFDKVLSSIQVD